MTLARLTYITVLCALATACSIAEEVSSKAERAALPAAAPLPPAEPPTAREEVPTPSPSPAQTATNQPVKAPEEKVSPEEKGPSPIAWADLENPAMVVRTKPTKKSDRVGSVRRGRTFPIYEYAEGRGCKKPWARIGPGWVCSDRFAEAKGPTGPSAPLPFKYGVVYEDTEIHLGPSRRMKTGKIR